jgi:arsenate reductase
MIFYGYDNCSTCKKAEKFLKDSGIIFEKNDIVTTPPDTTTLKNILDKSEYTIKDLFNKSGQMYREMDMKNKIDNMSEKELLELLSKNGKLVKRPLLINKDKFAIGFKEEVFKKVIS